MSPSAHIRLIPPDTTSHSSANIASLDKDIVLQAQLGHRAAQEEVFAVLYPIVRKQLHFQLGGSLHDTLEETVQEAMLKIFRGLPTFRGDAKLSTWALKIAIHHARRCAKRLGKARSIPLEDWVETGFHKTPSATSAQVSRLLAALTPKKREAFVLMEVMEMTASEAGQALGVSANTAASRCRHAKLELHQALEESAQ